MRACMTCARLDRTERGATTCSAFPDGIPAEINQGRVSHTQPYPGDHGQQWLVWDAAPADVKAANHPFPSQLNAA